MSDLILSIDQGTTGSTVMILDARLNVLAKINHEYPQHYPKPGWVEHDPEDIWKSSVRAIQDALTQSGRKASDIAAIGITNQRETSLFWNRETGKSYHNAVVWQCRRTAELCNSLKSAGYEETFQKKTGLLLDPYFSGTKLKWQLDYVPGLRAEAETGKAICGTIDTFLVWRLTGGAAHVTDVSNASRTLLMNLNTLQWDDELCDILAVPKRVLPEVRSCSEIYGTTKNVPGLPDGIPISGMAGDQQAALFGQACFLTGEAKCTYGTGAFLLMNTGDEPVPSKNRLLTTVAWKVKDRVSYALEGSAFIAGAAVQWLRDGLQVVQSAPEIEQLALQVPDTGGVMFVPAFVGLGAPHWRSDARALLRGMTRGTTRAHIARACLEGIALQNVEILKAMEADSGQALVRLKVDGGASANNLLMQMQANFLGREIVRPKMVETTALGAAFLAGLGVGIWHDTAEIVAAWKQDRQFNSEMNREDREAILASWAQAVAAC